LTQWYDCGNIFSGGDKVKYHIPTPLRNLMTERSSLKTQLDKLQNDYEMIQDEKAKAVAEYEEKLNDILVRRDRLQREWEQFNHAVETMKQTFQIPEEEQVPPEEEQTI
jgi:predicted nuclease with TOPRIM domain